MLLRLGVENTVAGQEMRGCTFFEVVAFWSRVAATQPCQFVKRKVVTSDVQLGTSKNFIGPGGQNMRKKVVEKFL